jgi:hypothetical protein
MEWNFCIKCGFSALHCLLFYVFTCPNEAKNHLNKMITWDQVCHLEQTEGTSYGNEVWLLHNLAARSTQLWFCKAAVKITLSSVTLHKINIKTAHAVV